MFLNGLIDEVWSLIQKAGSVIYSVLHKTPLEYNTSFSRMFNASVFLKLENMQKTGSFKSRGAFFKIYSHLDEARKRGVVAASSGNHAQGVAFAASALGVKATIVMPETAPIFKINATRSYGAEVVLYGRVYDDACQKALEIMRETGAMFVHPFNDKEVIAGQGTIGLEIASQLPDVEVVVVPIGGGGLISGIGVALKKHKPGVKIVGVEPEVAAKYYESRRVGQRLVIEPKLSLADGVVTKTIGDLTWEIMNQVVDDVVKVSEDSIAQAIYLLLERSKVLAEGAGALPLAAMLEGHFNNTGKKTVLVVSGGNIDLTMLYRVVIRGLATSGRISIARLVVPDAPGQLYRVLEVLYKYRCNIIDVKHDRFNPIIPIGHAVVDLVFEAPSGDIVRELIKEFKEMGYRVE